MNEKSYLAGAIFIFVFSLLICAASIGYSGADGYTAGGFSFAWGSAGLSREQVFDMSEIQKVEILCDSMNVVFRESDGETCTVMYQHKKRKGGDIRTDFDDLLEWSRKKNEAKGSYGDGSGIRIYTQASSGNTRVVLR